MRSRSFKVRVDGLLAEHVAENIGENGRYEHAGEYIRDLIRHDCDRLEKDRSEAIMA